MRTKDQIETDLYRATVRLKRLIEILESKNIKEEENLSLLYSKLVVRDIEDNYGEII